MKRTWLVAILTAALIAAASAAPAYAGPLTALLTDGPIYGGPQPKAALWDSATMSQVGATGGATMAAVWIGDADNDTDTLEVACANRTASRVLKVVTPITFDRKEGILPRRLEATCHQCEKRYTLFPHTGRVEVRKEP